MNKCLFTFLVNFLENPKFGPDLTKEFDFIDEITKFQQLEALIGPRHDGLYSK